jgi:hypothetical protein
MLKPPEPMTNTFLTSTRFCAPAITPLLMYACALGAVWLWFHVAESFEKARSCRYTACDSWLARSARTGAEARDVKVLAETEGVVKRYCRVRAGARRARRPQRAMSGGRSTSNGTTMLYQHPGGQQGTRRVITREIEAYESQRVQLPFQTSSLAGKGQTKLSLLERSYIAGWNFLEEL